MKFYEKPETDIVILHTTVNTLTEDVPGEPKGSYNVNPLNPDAPITIGDDDDDFAPVNRSLWDQG